MKLRHRWSAATVGCGLVLIMAGCAMDQGWRQAMEQGQAAVRAGEYPKAEEQFTIARNEAKVVNYYARSLFERAAQGTK